MKVKNLMHQPVYTVSPEDTLHTAGGILARIWAGVLPVEDAAGKIVGILTDRDMFLALTARDAMPSRVRVAEVMHRDVEVTHPEEDLLQAMRTMERRGLRRLPVVDRDGAVVGMLSLDDVVERARAEGGPEHLGLFYPSIVDAYRAAVEARKRAAAAARARAG